MAQTINFDRWIMYGSGWEVSFVAQLENLTVTRAYGSDYATVTGKAWIKSVGGSTNTRAKFWIQLDGTNWTEVNIAGSNGSGGWYTFWAGDWYSQTFSFNVAVGAGSGNLSGQVCFSVYDINGPSADSEYKTYAQSYGSKGASSITSATNVTLSTSGTVNSSVSWTAYSNTFTYVLSASLGGYSASATYSSLSGNVTKTLGFSSSFINAITTSKSATCTITLTTKSGSTVIGTSTKNITLTVPSGINPSVTISTQKVSALSSTYFANKYCTLLDKIKVTLSETTQYGSAITSRSITANGETGTISPWTSSALKNYGANTVTARITDGRSNSGTASTSVNVYWYFYPTVSVKYRHGTDYYLDITGRIAYVGGDQTTKQLRLSIYKGTTQIVSNLNLDSYIASSPSGGTYDGYLDITGTYTIPAEYITDIATETYEFRLTVTDTVKSTTVSAYSGISVMTFGAGGTDITAHKPLVLDDILMSTHTKNNWDNSVSLLMIDPKYQGDVWRVSQNSSSYPPETPFGAITAVFYRQQFAYWTPTSNLSHAVVVLWEVYPINGRIWVRAYNTSWYSWKCVYTQPVRQHWAYTGTILKGASSMAGYGHVDIFLEPSGLYRCEWSARITTAGSSSSYQGGLDPSTFSSVLGKTLTPIGSCGRWEQIGTSGALNYSNMGYAPSYNVAGNRWALSRYYNTSGSNGTWNEGIFSVDQLFRGVCYGS